MIYDKEEIGKRIARQRKKMGYSQEELAFMVGLSKNQISSIECGKSTPKLPLIFSVCNHLGGTPDSYLIGIKSKTTDEIVDLVRGLSEKEQNKLIKMLKIYKDYDEENRR
jgi:transcriptional regulator with XRE-family HTH domain